MKKISCIILSLILLISVFAPLSVYANTDIAQDNVPLLQEGEVIDTFSPKYSISDSTLATAQDIIYDGLINVKSYFDLSSYKIPVPEFLLIYSNVINDNPELFYVSSNIEYGYYKSNNTVASVYPKYSCTSAEIESAKDEYNLGMAKALSLVDDTMTDLQKAIVIHDYICSKAIYPTDDKDIYHSAYGFFKDYKIVCAGYALVYSAILKEIGIPCRYVISNSMEHAWNAVCINGKWYNADLTWDDTTFTTTGKNSMGTYCHIYFLKSTADFEANKGHSDSTFPDNIECTDTSFDDAFWDSLTSNIYVYNGDYYYLDLDAENFYINLIKRDVNANTTRLNTANYQTVYSQYSNGINVPLAKLVRIGDVLYFSHSTNTSAYIRSYDLKTGDTYLVYNHTDKNAGLGEENGILYYSLYSDRYNYLAIDKAPIFDSAYPANKSNSRYNPYVDVNNDGCINSKDYVLINILV